MDVQICTSIDKILRFGNRFFTGYLSLIHHRLITIGRLTGRPYFCLHKVLQRILVSQKPIIHT